jgi:hypothetical protein
MKHKSNFDGKEAQAKPGLLFWLLQFRTQPHLGCCLAAATMCNLHSLVPMPGMVAVMAMWVACAVRMMACHADGTMVPACFSVWYCEGWHWWLF